MADNFHDVVKLLLARMDSHPEEFTADLSPEDSRQDRWWQVIRYVSDYGTEEEQKAIQAGLRKVKLQRAHEIMMDELCNGDERRRKEQEEQEYEKRIIAQHAKNMGASMRAAISPALQQIDMQMQQQQLEAYKNTYATYNTETDTYQLGNGLTFTRAEIQDNPGLLATIKKAIGL